MGLTTIKGQDRIIKLLQRSLETGRLAHAYLFEGPDGVGRRSTALALARTIYCKTPVNHDACESCISCRKVNSGIHPDIHFLELLPDKRDIKIEQIRELQRQLTIWPLEGQRRICLIEPAERLNEHSANALLKTLEEPPGNALFILLTNQADMLLPTIRSRCQHLRFGLLPETEICELLQQQGYPPDQARQMAALAEGSISKVLSLQEKPVSEQRTRILEILSQVDSRQIATIFDSAETFASNREEAVEKFGHLISVLRDMLLILSSQKYDLVNIFAEQQLVSEANRFAKQAMLELIELALKIRQAVQRGANNRLAMERFLLEYHGHRKGVK